MDENEENRDGDIIVEVSSCYAVLYPISSKSDFIETLLSSLSFEELETFLFFKMNFNNYKNFVFARPCNSTETEHCHEANRLWGFEFELVELSLEVVSPSVYPPNFKL